MPVEKPIEAYTVPALKPGVRTSFTTPLCMELINKGQGQEVLSLLHSVNLEIQQLAQNPWFRIIQRR